MWKLATADALERLCLPDVDADAVAGLKFGEALPERLGMSTLASRLADLPSAERVLGEPAPASRSATSSHVRQELLILVRNRTIQAMVMMSASEAQGCPAGPAVPESREARKSRSPGTGRPVAIPGSPGRAAGAAAGAAPALDGAEAVHQLLAAAAAAPPRREGS